MNERQGYGRASAAGAAVLVAMLLAGACSSSGGKTSSGSSGTTSATTTAALYPTSSATSSDGKVTISSVSAPAPYVSGDELMVKVTSATVNFQTDPDAALNLDLEVNGKGVAKDVSPTVVTADSVQQVIHGLVEGHDKVSVTIGGSTATLDVVDHPIQGPVFSGPRQTPFACTTEAEGLGPSSPPDCSAATKVSWDYVTTSGKVLPVPASGTAPTDVATRADGKPAYVYDEEGVIDRSVYEIAVPVGAPGSISYQPASLAWNKRLVYRFGGGCGTTYSQGSDFASVLDPKLLAKGYAVTTSTLNTFQSACNTVLSAEVAMMIKQHFIQTFGLPTFTIGDGGSGGSIQQLQIAQNYPGLLDGLSPELPFPDSISISGGVSDCTLLDTYYAGAGSSLTAAQRMAINGHGSDQTCQLWQASFAKEIEADGCGATVPKDQVFDPVTNPKGVRCTLQDGNVNILGIDPATGFAYRPVTNVGVQYGLQALADHKITAAEFVALNARIGGFDVNGKVVAARTTGPDKAFEVAYAKGGVDEGGALWNVPIILTNPYDDPIGDIHDRFRSFSIRARLTRPDGSADPNLVLWTVPGPTDSGSLDAQLAGALADTSRPIEVLDEWLTKAQTSPLDADASAKLAAARPAEAVDTCTLSSGQVLKGDDVYTGSNACTRAYPVHGDPRTAAGAPLRNDILSCQLEPVSSFHYPVTLTSSQQQQLAQTFPSGVCDWSKTGVGQVPVEGTWLDYGS
jgi:Tannase-like family of unknown function (DUF6351)